MAYLLSILSPIIALAACGAFIDFLIGPAGQKKLKNKMEEAWYRFHEVNWYNFGQKEAQYYIDFADWVFGKNIFSVKRTVFVSISTLFIVFISGLMSVKLTRIHDYLENIPHLGSIFLPDFAAIAIEVALFSISLSITRNIAQIIIAHAADRRLGPLPFVFMLICHYILFVIWFPIISIPLAVFAIAHTHLGGLDSLGFIDTYLKTQLATFSFRTLFWHPLFGWISYLAGAIDVARIIPPKILREAPHMASVISDIRGMIEITLFGLLGNGIRIVFGLVLLVGYIGREWIGRLFSLVWARLVESEKPVFTLLLGGIGGIASLLSALLSQPH